MHLSVIFRAGLVAAALASAALYALPARADARVDGGAVNTLSVTGTGEIAVAPDMATIRTGVESEAGTAREALDANNMAIAAVIAALKDAGIEARDIQTSGFNVQPRYQRADRNSDQPERKIIGYTVSNTVMVAVRDLDTLGGVLDAVVGAGGNRIGGIAFLVSDADKRLDEARTLAIKDATRKARLYAEAAGVSLDGIVSISEGGGFQPFPRQEAMMMRDAAVSAVPIETGEQTLSVSVAVTWKIEN